MPQEVNTTSHLIINTNNKDYPYNIQLIKK